MLSFHNSWCARTNWNGRDWEWASETWKEGLWKRDWTNQNEKSEWQTWIEHQNGKLEYLNSLNGLEWTRMDSNERGNPFVSYVPYETMECHRNGFFQFRKFEITLWLSQLQTNSWDCFRWPYGPYGMKFDQNNFSSFKTWSKFSTRLTRSGGSKWKSLL